jgi:hypothetical protein
MTPIVAVSARRHDLAEEDILHAYRQAVRVYPDDDGLDLMIGPARSGDLLEIGVVGADGGTDVIVHAMRARRKYL